MDVTAVRVPWRFGDDTVTVTPGSASPLSSAARPVRVPVGFCARAGIAIARTHSTISNLFDIVFSSSFLGWNGQFDCSWSTATFQLRAGPDRLPFRDRRGRQITTLLGKMQAVCQP